MPVNGRAPLKPCPIERRIVPRYPVDTRIFASIAGQTVRLGNISESGVAIHGSGLAPGSVHLLEINLNHTHLILSVEILDCSGEGRLHARFVNPSLGAQRVIQAYIRDLRWPGRQIRG